MVEQIEIAVLKADVLPVKGREVFWLLSKAQIEHVLQDAIIQQVPFCPRHISGLALWQGLALPVVSLETFFKFKTAQGVQPKRRVVVKTISVREGRQQVARLMLNIPHDLRVRPIDSSFVSTKTPVEELAARGLSGIYTWERDKLGLLPDLSVIASGRSVSV